MALFGTNLAEFILLQCTIQQRQLTELLLLVYILFIVNDNQHLFDHIRRGIDGPLIISRDYDM